MCLGMPESTLRSYNQGYECPSMYYLESNFDRHFRRIKNQAELPISSLKQGYENGQESLIPALLRLD